MAVDVLTTRLWVLCSPCIERGQDWIGPGFQASPHHILRKNRKPHSFRGHGDMNCWHHVHFPCSWRPCHSLQGRRKTSREISPCTMRTQNAYPCEGGGGGIAARLVRANPYLLRKYSFFLRRTASWCKMAEKLSHISDRGSTNTLQCRQCGWFHQSKRRWQSLGVHQCA